MPIAVALTFSIFARLSVAVIGVAVIRMAVGGEVKIDLLSGAKPPRGILLSDGANPVFLLFAG